MIDVTRTTSTLLSDLHQPGNQQAWEQIHARYHPVLVNVARRAGLSDTDAADVAQDSLADLFRSLLEKRYDRNRGRLRQWLLAIARLRIADTRRKRASAGATIVTTISDQADDVEWTAAWDAEQRTTILNQALERLRQSDKLQAHTLAAFEMTALRNMPAAEVAAELKLTTQEVYLAKSRCLERVRGIIVELERAYSEDDSGA